MSAQFESMPTIIAPIVTCSLRRCGDVVHGAIVSEFKLL
jgi:hypothetical protein